MAFKSGANCAVKLGTTTVVGVGNFTMSGVVIDQYETSAFGDTRKTFISGMQDGGQISFSGVYDPADTTGQTALRNYADNGTQLTSLRLYIDGNSYWIPTTTNPASYVTITDWSINADMQDAIRMDFTAKVSGKLELL